MVIDWKGFVLQWQLTGRVVLLWQLTGRGYVVGFSETEIRFKTPDGKVGRTVEKKSKKVKTAPKVHRHPEGGSLCRVY